MTGLLKGLQPHNPSWKNHGTGGGTSFTLDVSSTTNATLLIVGGVIQLPGSDYTVSGQTISCSSSVSSGIEVLSAVLYDLGSVTTPAAGSVNFASLGFTSQAQGDILYRDSSTWARLPAGTSGQFLKTQGTGANPAWGTVSAGEFLLYHHTAASNTAGDTYANGAWRTVTLDTEVYDTGSNGSLSSNVITLGAGTYRVVGYTTIASASSTAYFGIRFRNTSDSSTVATSSVIAVEQDRPVIVICRNRFTIAGSKNFELQVFPGSNNGYESAGGPVDNGEANIFGVAYLEKE